MAETLGSLCDKLTIVKLKQWHSEDPDRLKSLAVQQANLTAEIDEFLGAAVGGAIPVERLSFSSNKVFKASGNEFKAFVGTIGQTVSELARVNCELWHEQEKVYEFEKVDAAQKDHVVKRLAILNLERNKCIDQIDQELKSRVTQKAEK